MTGYIEPNPFASAPRLARQVALLTIRAALPRETVAVPPRHRPRRFVDAGRHLVEISASVPDDAVFPSPLGLRPLRGIPRAADVPVLAADACAPRHRTSVSFRRRALAPDAATGGRVFELIDPTSGKRVGELLEATLRRGGRSVTRWEAIHKPSATADRSLWMSGPQLTQTAAMQALADHLTLKEDE